MSRAGSTQAEGRAATAADVALWPVFSGPGPAHGGFWWAFAGDDEHMRSHALERVRAGHAPAATAAAARAGGIRIDGGEYQALRGPIHVAMLAVPAGSRAPGFTEKLAIDRRRAASWGASCAGFQRAVHGGDPGTIVHAMSDRMMDRALGAAVVAWHPLESALRSHDVAFGLTQCVEWLTIWGHARESLDQSVAAAVEVLRAHSALTHPIVGTIAQGPV